MDAQTPNAPPPSPAAEPAAPAPQQPQTRAARKAAAVEVINRGRTAPRPEAEQPPEAAQVAAPAADTPPPEAPKEQPLSPQLAELAKRDAAQRTREQKHRADVEAWHKQVAEQQDSRASADQLVDLARTNPVAFAETAKLSPAERRDMADLLYWSSYGDEERGKLPQEYRDRMAQRTGQLRPLSELEKLRQLTAKQAEEFEAYKAQQAQAAKDADSGRVRTSFLDAACSEIDAARTPILAALLEADPEVTRGAIWQAAIEAAQEEPDGDVGMAKLGPLLEAALEQRFAPLRKAFSPAAPKPPQPAGAPPARAASSSVPESAVASATSIRSEPQTRAERKAAALAKLEAARGGQR